jgi:collagenase-like PrtC family protease
LHKGNDPNVLWISTRLQFQLHGFAKAFSPRQLPDLCDLLHNRNVRQVLAAVFAM